MNAQNNPHTANESQEITALFQIIDELKENVARVIEEDVFGEFARSLI